MNLTGRTAAVFGGGSTDGEITNGLASALAYAGAGASIAIVDLHAESAERARDTVLDRFPEADVLTLQGDVTDTESVADCVGQILSLKERIDVLHNNVGVATMGGPLELEVEEWERALSLNLTSAFITVKHVLPGMLDQGRGSIINIASVGGMRYVGYNYPAYAAAKAGLIQFTSHLAVQYGRQGIRANSISPGFIASPMMFQQITGNYSSAEEMVDARNQLSPTGAMGTPTDIGTASVFLASDGARYINGVCLPVDGGFIEQASLPMV
ncbi:SDR family oxidoreductase [Nesterenkonia salmonea]|uniref:SDR family oxidoreductase n=1 Tax=Nesterenkonia salmonea TaxID=1804987 RepID=A0A5R9BBK1_9MICC|nr:SDR family oxidoreductase [Nesterenkonia salmonea]TLP98035.1 SDR family oxidoreductase [Nesterenkonia salmonea]